MDTIIAPWEAALNRIANALEKISKALQPAIILSKNPVKQSKFDSRRNAWTREEDEKLKAGKKLGMSWDKIAQEYLPGRTPAACHTRYSLIKKDESNGA